MRNLLVDNILKTVEVNIINDNVDDNKNERKEKFEGLEYMLENNYFQDAFTLHEETRHPFEMKQFKKTANFLFKTTNFNLQETIKHDKRIELQEKWANLTNLLKLRYQPINLIKSYFGEEIAIYFAWVGMINTYLCAISFIGICFFVAGLGISIRSNFNLDNKLNSTNHSKLVSSCLISPILFH
jgi:hypothetical protein